MQYSALEQRLHLQLLVHERFLSEVLVRSEPLTVVKINFPIFHWESDFYERSLLFPVETFGQSKLRLSGVKFTAFHTQTGRERGREGEMMSRPRERMGKFGVTATMFETSSDQDAVSPNLSDNLFVSPMLSLRRGHE